VGGPDDASDIEGSFVAFRQLDVRAPNGRSIYPDIVYLWQSGHVVVAEVKLADNPELKDRRVVAQILEYAASLASYTESELLALFGKNHPQASSWVELVSALFPSSIDPERLSRRFVEKFRNSRLHLLIVCDEAPIGLRDLVRGVVGQSALGEYEFRVAEVLSFSTDGDDQMLFFPHSVLTTEIVARTTVTVALQGEEHPPTVSVSVTPLEEQEAAIQETRGKNLPPRNWDEDSFLEDGKARLKPGWYESFRQALGLTLQTPKSNDWRTVWGKGTKIGSLRVTVPKLSDDFVFSLNTDGSLWLNLRSFPDALDPEIRQRLEGLPGIKIPSTGGGTAIRPEIWLPHAEAILKVFADVATKAPSVVGGTVS
jgi:hypothetical protein